MKFEPILGNKGTSYVWDTDKYTSANMTAMATAGMVFFPCAGIRSNIISSVNRNGYTWSSSGQSEEYAYSFRFATGVDTMNPNMHNTRKRGRSVRLVREVIAPLVMRFDGSELTINCETDGVSIYYAISTVDMASVPTPTTSSNLYGGAITIGETTYIKAIAVKDGYPNSDVVSAVCAKP